MSTRIIKIMAFAFALLAVNACEDKLEIADPNRLSSEQFYKTQDQAVAAVDAIYNVLIIDGLYQRMLPILSDGRSDELSSRSPWPWFTGLSTFTFPATSWEPTVVWAAHYMMVSRANQAIHYIPEIADVEETLRNRLLGQAYFLRGFAYFNIANIYEKAPLITAVAERQEDFYPSNKDVTQEMLFDQAKADLEFAASNLPVTYTTVEGPDAGDVGRATKGAALSMLGKLNLYRNNFEAARDYFKQVIDLNAYSLNENYANLFTGETGVEQADPEKIFWAEFTPNMGSDINWAGDPNANWRQMTALSLTYSVNDFFDFYPTNRLYTEMRQEKTIDGKLDPRYHATILSYEPTEGYTTAYGTDWFAKGYAVDAYFIKKYTTAATGGDPWFASFNYHIIRYADVLLMYAESLTKTGNIAEAAKYVQLVRDRANLPDREAEFAAYSIDQFMTQLAHERTMELGIEGSRWNDIERWGWLDDPAKLAALKANDFEFNTYTPGKKYMPIPQDDLDRNPNLVGNSAN